MKHLLLAMTLTLTATTAMAQKVIEVKASLTHQPQEIPVSTLLQDLQENAERLCAGNAVRVSPESYFTTDRRFGHQGTIYHLTTVTANFECLSKNKSFSKNEIDVQVVIKHCLEKDPRNTLIGQIEAKADEMCMQVTGYPNAILTGEHTFQSRITSFGYPGCSSFQNTTISGKYKCLSGNK